MEIPAEDVGPLEGAPIAVLDFGYLKLIQMYGSDESIVEAARMSTNKGFLGWGPKGIRCPHTGCGWEGAEEEAIAKDDLFKSCCPRCVAAGRMGTGLTTIPGDEKLLRYLYENAHATPFEMAGLIIEVKAPIFVFREWHRHRTQSYNEMSARYTPLPDENYMPTADRCLMVGGANKQAGAVKGADELTHEAVLEWLGMLQDSYDHAERVYQHGLGIGIPKEIARLPVPVARYSRMRAHANLRNWLAFLTLRKSKNAQWEIRQFANALHGILVYAYPRTMQLFDEGFRG